MQTNFFNSYITLLGNQYKHSELFFDTKCYSNKIPIFVYCLYKLKLISGAFTYKQTPDLYTITKIYPRLRLYFKFTPHNKQLFKEIQLPKHLINLTNKNIQNYLTIFKNFYFPLLIIKTNKGLIDGYRAAKHLEHGPIYAIIKK